MIGKYLVLHLYNALRACGFLLFFLFRTVSVISGLKQCANEVILKFNAHFGSQFLVFQDAEEDIIKQGRLKMPFVLSFFPIYSWVFFKFQRSFLVVLFLDFPEKRKQMDAFLTAAAAVSFALLDHSPGDRKIRFKNDSRYIRLRLIFFLIPLYQIKQDRFSFLFFIQRHQEKIKGLFVIYTTVQTFYGRI